MLPTVAVTHGAHAAGFMAEQSPWEGAGWDRQELSPWESHAQTPGAATVTLDRQSSAHFHPELAQAVLLSCAALVLLCSHTYGLQTSMGCLDHLGRAHSPSQ